MAVLRVLIILLFFHGLVPSSSTIMTSSTSSSSVFSTLTATGDRGIADSVFADAALDVGRTLTLVMSPFLTHNHDGMLLADDTGGEYRHPIFVEDILRTSVARVLSRGLSVRHSKVPFTVLSEARILLDRPTLCIRHVFVQVLVNRYHKAVSLWTTNNAQLAVVHERPCPRPGQVTALHGLLVVSAKFDNVVVF